MENDFDAVLAHRRGERVTYTRRPCGECNVVRDDVDLFAENDETPFWLTDGCYTGCRPENTRRPNTRRLIQRG